MDSFALGTLVTVEDKSQALPTTPSRAVHRTYPAVPQNYHADGVEYASRQGNEGILSGPTTPMTERDLEMTAPSSPAEPEDGIPVQQSVWNPYMNRFRLATCCLLNFGNGLNDSAPGALIPYMEEYYNIGYAIVSLIFVGNALGFILAATCVDTLRARLGRAKVQILSQACMICGYIPIVASAPFPVIVVSFFFLGFGMALNLAIGNVFCANLQNSTSMLGAMHGSYGLGGTIGPLIATSIVGVGGAVWSRYYLLNLSLATFSLFFAAWSFWNYEKELGPSATLLNPPRGTTGTGAMLSSLKSKTVLLGALFIFAYQGSEVSISGWVISFLISARGGNPSSVGYVTAGFWAGITLGRFFLAPIGPRVGEKSFVYAIVIGSAVFELLVWLVPNVIGDAVSVAIVGLLLGPVYPCAASIFAQNLSRREQVSGMGIISAMGSSGGAVAPFMTGLLAQAVGTFVLHPIAIGLFGAMIVCWYGIPNPKKRAE